jgi:hypothetical protein
MTEISTIIRARLDEGRAIADEDVRALLNENEKLRAALRGLLEWAGPIAGDTRIVEERAYEEETVAAAYAALGEKDQTND